MLEKLFYIMSLCRHFTSLNHLADVVRTGLEYVPRVPLEMSTLIFILFILNYMKIRIFKKIKHRGIAISRKS
jgi:hypothetical protein